MAPLTYHTQGQGFPVVFIHGFCESKEIWQEFIHPFQTGFRSITVDLPGFGENTDNIRYQSIDALAEEVHLFLQEQAIEKVILIAHSLGGYVALALADKYPQLVAGLCLFHSTALADSEEKKQGRNKTVEAIQNKGMDAFLDGFVPGLFYKERHTELSSQMKKVRELTGRTPAATAVAVTLAMRDRPDRTHVLKNVSYPVLFIAGKNDTAVPFDASKELFFLPAHAMVQALADTAHMGMFEKTAETQASVKGFIEMCIKLS
jgi:pimeloyl-ACP methyl ester carboxylesterase